ncbi:hypothetical protein PR202_gb15158 [Eleusine coracana subsp. coracana]|uniref:Ubiquitin-like-conjugating enzyme ATG10 n=1 Tax=Eleusine coracana subsp. coracana TaxID=191504 RepID=A0AAV5EX85_ELECO|nr:hypothetical protein PR202_gb15158 [Eleusine coracana subsp. coracana]
MGGSSVWDGTLSLDGFNASATALIKQWEEMEVDESLPDWAWRPCYRMGVPSEVEGYLALEGVYRNCGENQIEDRNDFDDADIVADDSWVQSSSDVAHVYDFHAVYSHSYREHPHLSRPWFTLHPCGTSDWMKLLLQETEVMDKEKTLKYLPAWLSVVGQAVGLKIPLELHCSS